MDIILYKCNDNSNVVDKTLKDSIQFEINFKGDCNVTNPTIVMNNSFINGYNYAYIPLFKRYYYIDDITVYPNDIYTLNLRCDLLMTYKDDIKNSQGFIIQQSEYNNYYNDNYECEVKREVNIYNSEIGINPTSKSIILSTIGGI